MKIGKPEVSCHWCRHFFATISLHAGANLVDVSRALGHSSVAVTSIYLHSSDAAVSELIDLSTAMDGDTIDESITYVKTERKKKIKSQKNIEKSQKKKSQFV